MKKIENNELGRISVEDFKNSPKTPIVVVLDNVRSLNNIGSIFRTCDAFAVEAIYICGISGTPPDKEISKTALGATESVKWKYFSETADAVKELKEQKYIALGIEQVEGSFHLNSFMPLKECKYAVVFGNEVKGVDQSVVDLCDFCIEIPQFGTKHSFNVSVSAGIVLWDLYNKVK